MSKIASRFIFIPEYIHEGNVEKEAFLPPSSPRPYETSVIMHGNEGPDWTAGWKIGQKKVRPKPLLGSAEVGEPDIVSANLRLEPCPTGISQYHANIKGWSEFEKAERLMQAEMLASRSTLVVETSRGTSVKQSSFDLEPSKVDSVFAGVKGLIADN